MNNLGLLSFIKNTSLPTPENTNNWYDFNVKDIFNISTGGHIRKENLIEGTTPRISVTGINNGIVDYYQDIKDKDYRTEENFISFSFLGTCFYHPYKASVDMKVHVLKPIEHKMNIYSGLFVVSVIRKLFSGTYIDQISSSDLKMKKIYLPEKNRIPDWQYMENYIKNIYDKIEKLII
jgi:hypothetical protein